MNCPRCKSPIGPLASPDAIVTCPGCGTRLMTRSAALKSQGGSQQIPPAGSPGAAPEAPAAAAAPAASPGAPSSAASAVQRTTPAFDPGTLAAPSLEPDPTPEPPPAASHTAVKVGRHTVGRSSSGSVRSGGRRSDKGDGVTLEMLLAEIKAVQETQLSILDALAGLGRRPAEVGADSSAPTSGSRRGGDGGGETPAEGTTTLSPIRAAARKSVLLVDDNPKTRQAALEELEKADIPVRAFAEGNKALAAIAYDKPDLIILELAVGGDMSGKDLVNMIKATMEWVDIPIVLWTRENVSNQREARQLHGADEVVMKSAGAAALVARVITLFRR
jgi:CheY-like chemotaxis protein